MDITQSLDDEVQSTLVITHLPQQIHHFRNEIALLTYLVRLLSAVLAPDVVIDRHKPSRVGSSC